MNKCTNCGTTVSSDTINFDPDGFGLCDYCEEEMLNVMAAEEDYRIAKVEGLYEVDVQDLQKIALGEMTAEEYMEKHPVR